MSYTTYLAHHGIKGQKWGVRRFQNEDGTLTKAGLKRAGYKFKTIRKNATTSRILIDENEDTSKLDRAYFSTNNLDNQKWANYFASIGAQHLDKSAYAVNFKAKKKLIIARGEEISKVASKLMDKDDTFRKEFEATRQKQIQSTGSEEAWDSLSESAKYSAMIAYKCEGGKKIISAMKDIGFDGVEDLFGKDVSKDPIIIFNPGSNLRQVGQKQELKGLYRGYRKYYGLPINHSYFSCHNISDNAGGSNQMFMNDDLLAYGAYLEHHGIKGQKWGVRRFQKADGSLTAAGAKRYGIKSAMSAGRKVGAGLVKAARGGIQKAKEAKARKAAEKLERQKKVWAKTRLGLTMNADKFTVEELREANNRLDERDRAARGLAEQVKRGVGYFQAIRDVTGAIKDTKDYIEDISGEKGKKAKAADELKYQRELEKEKRTYERDMVRDQLKANQEYEYKREKDKLDRESKEKIEKMKAKTKKKKDSGSSDSDQEPDDAPKKKKPSENTTEFEDVYWNSSKKDREFMETVFPKEVDEAKERKKRRNKARREVDEAIRRMGFFGHSDISIYGAYLEHHGIKGQKWGVRRFQNYDGTRINKNHTSDTADTKQAVKTLNTSFKKYMHAVEEMDDDGMEKAISQLGHDKSFQRSVKPVVDIVNSTYEKHKDVFDEYRDIKSEKMQSYLHDLQKIDDCVKDTAKKLGIKDIASDSYEYNFFTNALAGYVDSIDTDDNRRFLQSDWIVHGVLEHHGIKGQKWGIRRFQNEDGTRIIKKGTRFKRTSIHEDDPTFDNKKYVSTNNRDARKWRDYLGNAYAQRGRIVYEHEYKTTKDIVVARGKDISAVINEEFKKNPKKWKQLNDDTDRAMKMLNYVKDNMSDDDLYSTNFAAQTNSGKEIMRMLQKRGYDAVEDLHGRNVSDDPIIVFNPDENLKHKKAKQHWEYYYRNMYG